MRACHPGTFWEERNMKQLKPITNKLLWIFAIGQFGWSLLSGVVTNWMVY